MRNLPKHPLVIGKQDLRTALSEAKELKESMQGEKNTLLCMLLTYVAGSPLWKKEIGSREQERIAWQELCPQQKAILFRKSFHFQDASLKQYITYNK